LTVSPLPLTGKRLTANENRNPDDMKGVIFDMDGTMVNNMMIHHRAWQRKLAELGLKLTLEEVKEEIHGVNTELLERIFGDRFSPEDRIRISDEKEAEYRRIFLPELKAVAGLKPLLENIQKAGLPMSIGTAAPPDNVHFILENLQLQSYFKAVFHSGHVTKGKPDPEIFLKAAASLGLPTEECLVFEDSVTGAETAKRAGCKAIIVTTTHTPEEFRHFNHILAFIPDFRGLTTERMTSLFVDG
jgi:beta-phosphoglucomutase